MNEIIKKIDVGKDVKYSSSIDLARLAAGDWQTDGLQAGG